MRDGELVVGGERIVESMERVKNSVDQSMLSDAISTAQELKTKINDLYRVNRDKMDREDVQNLKTASDAVSKVLFGLTGLK